MLTWHTYAVILVPGLGLFACGRRVLAGAVWLALITAAVFFPLASILCAAAALQLVCILVSLRS